MIVDKIEEIVKNRAFESYDLGFLGDTNYGGWKIEKDTAQFIGKVCETLKPHSVLEFGTGLSTLILAHEASRGNVQRIWSVDHLSTFPNHPKDILIEKNQAKFVNLYCFPIRLAHLAGKFFQFYSIPSKFFDEAGLFDLVVIDGPPYYYNSREAAMYAIYQNLSPRCLILLDDANRGNRERRYLKNWKRYFGRNIGTALFFKEFKKGLACIWLTGEKEPVCKFRLSQCLQESVLSLKSELLRMARRLYQILRRSSSECLR